MKYCTACGHSIANDAKFCRECGEKQVIKTASAPAKVQESEPIQHTAETINAVSQRKKRLPGIYTLIFILAMLGPLHVLGLTGAYLFFGFLFKFNVPYLAIGTAWFITALLTFIAIILMMAKRKAGWKLYAISQVVYIIAAIFAVLALSSEPKSEDSEFVIAAVFILPALIFLIIFRRKKFKQYLR